MELRSVERILVRCPNWVGDVVMAVPLLESLRRSFPSARIAGCLRRYVRGVLEDGPWFDELIDCDDKSLAGLVRTARRFRAFRADVGIVLPNSVRSVLALRLGGVRRIYGYRRNLRGLLLSGGPRPTRADGRTVPVPMTQYYLGIAGWLGLDVADDNPPRLYISEELNRFGQDILRRYGVAPGDTVIGLNPGARFGSSKCWPAESFARLAELFAAQVRCKFLLLAGPGEDSIAEAIIGMSRAPIINTAPDRIDLGQLKPLVRRCNLLITNDTGPRHYATAFDVPAVVIMGPTDQRYTASHLENTVVIRRELDCAPCHKRICPTDHRCMMRITPQEVFEAGLGLLRARPAKATSARGAAS